ncbi:MAG: hypothetical protein SF182_02810 [Deltaproteobacteria bacterium]|nr:hypothetical protein [Deltaproteobacteria bacterium]
MATSTLLLAASLASATLAAAQEWQDLGPTGGEIADILLDDDGCTYAVGRGVFRREPGEAQWERLPRTPGPHVSLRGGTLWSTGGDLHVHRSVDRGATWEALAALPELSFDAPAVDAADDALLYAATVQADYVRRLYRSRDGGQSWQSIQQGLPDHDFSYHYLLRADVEHASSVFVASELYGVFASSDAGDHWIEASTGLPCPGVISAEGRLPCVLALEQGRDGTLYVGAADGRVYRSDDRARSWQSPHAAPLGVQVVALALAPRDPARVLAVTSSTWAGGHPPEYQVLRSSDGGAHFEVVGSGLPHGALHALVIDAEHSDRAYAATDDGVYASDDAGTSWIAVNDGLFATCVYALGAGGAPTTLHALGPQRYWRRSGAPEGWSEGDISMTYPGYRRIAVGSELAGVVVAPDGERLYAFDWSIGPFASEDGGRSWAPRFGDGGPFGAYDLALDPHDADSIFIATDYAAIAHSLDGGRHWERVHDAGGGSPGQVRGVATEARSGRVYALYDHATFASPPSGAHWRRIGRGIEGRQLDLEIAPTDPPTLLARTPYAVTMRSRDGGRTWRALHVPGETEFERTIVATASDPTAPHILYGVAGKQLYRSDDAGGTWRRVAAQLPTGVQQLQVDPNEPERIYAATCGAGVQLLVQEPVTGGRIGDGCAVVPADVSAALLAAHGLAIGLLGWLRARR